MKGRKANGEGKATRRELDQGGERTGPRDDKIEINSCKEMKGEEKCGN